MTKLCPVCKETQIDDKYQMCASCNIKSKEANSSDDSQKYLKEIADNLKHINWNLGKIYLHFKGDKETIKKIEKEENESLP